MNWLSTAWNWIVSELTNMTAVAKATSDPLHTLIEKNNFAAGPNKNGGIIYKNSEATNILLTTTLRQVKTTDTLTLPIILAWLREESLLCPLARDPNNAALAHEPDTEESFSHSDFGLAQFDGNSLSNDPIFADITKMTWDKQRDMLYNPVYAVQKFMLFAQRLVDNTDKEIAADASLLTNCPSRLHLIIEAYNAGLHGAALIDKQKGLKGDWSYSVNIVNTAKQFAKVLS